MPAAPKLPASIKVGHRDISIQLADDDELDGAFGDYLASKQRIRLAKDRMLQGMAETLLHELDHAIWPDHWTLVGDVEETFVSALAPRRAALMRDNPELFAWIFWALK